MMDLAFLLSYGVEPEIPPHVLTPQCAVLPMIARINEQSPTPLPASPLPFGFLHLRPPALRAGLLVSC